MIDSSFLESSFWDSYQNDAFTDFREGDENFSLGHINEFELNRYDLSGCSTPNDASSNSSNYSTLLDDLCSVPDSFVSDFLDSNISSFSDFDCPPYNSDSSKRNSSFSEINVSSINEFKQRNHFEYFQTSKSWSNLSKIEKEATLHALSAVVTYQMSIREQMEVIKIIDPTAVISPDCKEFALDCSTMSDPKFKKIKDFMQKQKLLLSMNSNSYYSTENSQSANVTKFLPKKTSSTTFPRARTKQKKQKEALPAEEKQLKLKRQKQTRKERKSGLFVYEKKLKIDINPSEEDEDVNVLE